MQITDQVSGVVRLDWNRLYAGSAPEYCHSAAVAGDGSLLRIRVSPPESGQVLYWQRLAAPGPSSFFGDWAAAACSGVLAAACCALGSAVSIVFIDSQQRLQRLFSSDCGITWQPTELIGYVPSSAVYGLAAAYHPGDGSLAVFHVDQSVLIARQCVSGIWQSPVAWDKSTGILSGVSCVFDRDWCLLVAGKDSSGDSKIWGLVYGAGDGFPAGAWSPLNEMASAPAGSGYAFSCPCLAKPDTFRCFYVEQFTGAAPYHRLFSSFTVPGSAFAGNLWSEPVPFDYDAPCSPALVSGGDYLWLCGASVVWRAPLALSSIDVSGDVVDLSAALTVSSGELVVTLANSCGKYASSGTAALAPVTPGCEIRLAPGLRTPAGNEVSPGLAFTLTACEHVTAAGRACLVLHALDGWAALAAWQARYQFRWNHAAAVASVKHLLRFVLARAGLKLEVVSASSLIDTFCPDFTILPGVSGASAVRALLSFVPDVLFFEGGTAYLVAPLSDDAPVYGYGVSHPVVESRLRESLFPVNHVQVAGYDPVAGAPVISEVFYWPDLNRSVGRLSRDADPNICSVAAAQARAAARLRRIEMSVPRGFIRVPVNCAQQLYDVVAVTVAPAGLCQAPRRVLGITLRYQPSLGVYDQKLLLGGV